MKAIKKLIVLIIFAGAVFLLVNWGQNSVYKMLYPIRYTDIVEEYAEEYSLDPYLVYGVIKAESNFVHDAHSGVARGLMQITDDTAGWIADKMKLKSFEPEMLDDPESNIRMGCFYLRYLLDYYKDTELALAAYNAGMGNVNRWLANAEHSADGKTLDNIPFKETREYVERVENYTEIYRERYEKLVN